MRIPHPDTLGPDEETRVPCPSCGKGMVTPTRAAKVSKALEGEPTQLPIIITQTMRGLPDDE